MPPKQRKIAIMGYRSVGKSTLALQYVQGKFVKSYASATESTFTKTITVGKQEYFLKLVDTAGQDEFSILPQSDYVMNIHGYVLVYSIASSRSFEMANIIYQRLLEVIGRVNVPIVLVGNKCDLHMERTVSFEEGKQLAADMGAIFMEVSAKQHDSVTDIFRTIIAEIERSNCNDQEKSCLLT